jgi:methyl-accepting chemotaxis protein
MSRIKSLGTLLIVSVALIVAVAVAGIVAYVSRSSYNLALHLERQAMSQSTRTVAESLKLFSDGASSTARALASQRVFKNAFSGEADIAQKRIVDTLKADPSLWSAVLFDANGKVIAGANASGESLVGQSRADRDYFKAVMGGQDFFCAKDIIVAKTGGEKMYIYSTAHVITGANGERLGGIGVFSRWSNFTERMVDPLRFGERGYAFIVDSRGVLVAHGGDKANMLKDISSEAFIQKMLAGKNGQLQYAWKGEDKHLDYATDPETGFTIACSAYVSDMAASANTQRNILIGIGIVALLLLYGGITLIVRRLVVAPIRDIQAFTGAIRKGDFKAGLHTNFKYELASLADDIRAMVADLKEKLGFSEGVLKAFVLPCSVFDKDNRTAFVNQRMLDVLERPGAPESFLGQTSGQLIYNEPNRETLSARALRENRMLEAETNFTPPSGKPKVFQVTSTPLTDMDGNSLGTLAVWFELTEIRTQHRQIEAQNKRIAEAAAAANTVSDQVASASEELAAQIEQSSRGSDEQRSRTAEAATAMEQMNSTVMEVARSAGTAAELAERAKKEAQQGESLVHEVVTTIQNVAGQAESLKADMTQLGHQAEGISQIMNVISDIADQTNLLALNAAIEAARAGDAGRGFAVVADEVRKLAEKTMQATNEVGKHIHDVQESTRKSIQNTDATAKAILSSTDLAGKSGEALREIVSIVDQTADQVRGIATASEEQSAASEEISRSTEDINRIASETAEAMVQSGQAVSELARLASELRAIINNMNHKG